MTDHRAEVSNYDPTDTPLSLRLSEMLCRPGGGQRKVNMKTSLMLLAATAALSGCCSENDAACNAERAASRPTAYVTPTPAGAVSELQRRVTVERIDVVSDSLAYGGKRGVYVIRDTKTGREFVGVSGVGIAELGSHPSGKTQSADER
jgi:hypothetical protein